MCPGRSVMRRYLSTHNRTVLFINQRPTVTSPIPDQRFTPYILHSLRTPLEPQYDPTPILLAHPSPACICSAAGGAVTGAVITACLQSFTRVHNQKPAVPARTISTMLLRGSCHCGAVKFTVQSSTPVPFMRCYCSICRKTTGGGGYAVNLGAHAKTMQVEGKEHTRIYHAKMCDDKGKEVASLAERHFCGLCGSHLWLFSPEWPDLIHPLASAIDTDLPTPPEKVEIMLKYKANWVDVPDADTAEGPGFKHFQEYPIESIEDWHTRHGLLKE